jgi:hypothetical protein
MRMPTMLMLSFIFFLVLQASTPTCAQDVASDQATVGSSSERQAGGDTSSGGAPTDAEQAEVANKLSDVAQVALVQGQTSTAGSSTSTPAPAKTATPVASKEDKSGTNPLNFQKEFRLFNEAQFLQGRGYQNITTLQYVHPFASNFSVRVRLPFVGNDVTGENQYGFGDFSMRANWVPYMKNKIGVMLQSEFFFNTASNSVLGTGKNTIAPGGVVAFFLNNGWIFAPAYQQTVSYAGDSTRRDINLGAIDLYLVKLTKSKRNWFILDPTIIADYKNDRTSGTLEFEAGQIVGRMMGGVGSIYIRPGVGLGTDRIYNWNLEVGFKLIGF